MGQSFGPRYHIIKLLGAGGMGAVYQAWDAELSVAVALKVIRTERRDRAASPDAERRFKNELLLARQVTHKNVVRIHDLGELDGVKYITMSYVQGEDLATTLRRDGKLPIGMAVAVARQIAAGLEAAHDAGVVHRDLKPANIMITAGADDVQAQIMDFGISVHAGDAGDAGAMGTLEYMAPEQGTGATIDARADIYAFGLIVYEMLTGPRRLAASSLEARIEAMRRRCVDGVPAPRTLDSAIPEALDKVVTRCLHPDPAARFQSTRELCAALAALDADGELIPKPWYLTPRLAAVAALFVAAMLGGTYFLAQRAAQPAVQPDPVSVVIADLDNRTGDGDFDRTLEPMLRRALEDAGFISAYDRGSIVSRIGVRPPDRLDEVAASELAAKQGFGVVLSGAVARDGAGYAVSLKAAHPVTGNVIADERARAPGKEQVLSAATNLVARVRTALGDGASESDQIFAMASVSATSLDVVRHYAAAQEASSNTRFDEALQNALAAVRLDPEFGLGYQLLAVTSRNLGKLQDAERYIQQALQYVGKMTEREVFSTRGFYLRLTGDYQKCVEEYSAMIDRYAADVVGHNQLALCLTQLRDMRRAVMEMEKVVGLLPNRALFRYNLSWYSSYAGRFEEAEREARAIDVPDAYSTLALAFAQVGQGELADAAESYGRMAGMGALGASRAVAGLADLAIVQGRYGDAVRMLADGARDDIAAENPDLAAAKMAAMGFAELSRGRTREASAAAEQALAQSRAVKIRFLAARLLAAAGSASKAQPLVDELAAELQAEPRAYARIVEAEIALAGNDARRAVTLATEANGLLDTWIGRLTLGRAYLAAGAFPQADAEFDRCLRRSGEALSMFLDEEPTYAFFPAVHYYRGRVREALNSADFADAYKAYTELRGGSGEDPMAAELRARS